MNISVNSLRFRFGKPQPIGKFYMGTFAKLSAGNLPTLKTADIIIVYDLKHVMYVTYLEALNTNQMSALHLL